MSPLEPCSAFKAPAFWTPQISFLHWKTLSKLFLVSFWAPKISWGSFLHWKKLSPSELEWAILRPRKSFTDRVGLNKSYWAIMSFFEPWWAPVSFFFPSEPFLSFLSPYQPSCSPKSPGEPFWGPVNEKTKIQKQFYWRGSIRSHKKRDGRSLLKFEVKNSDFCFY